MKRIKKLTRRIAFPRYLSPYKIYKYFDIKTSEINRIIFEYSENSNFRHSCYYFSNVWENF